MHATGKKYDKIALDKYTGEPCTLDVYRVLDAFQVTSQPRGHAIKKALNAGLRGKGGEFQDIVEAIDALIEDATLIWHNARNSDETSEPLAGKHFDRLMELKGVRQNAAPEHLHPRPEDFVHALPHEMGPR